MRENVNLARLGITTVRFAGVGTTNVSMARKSAENKVLYFPKPSWVVRTESNVRKEMIEKPDPPCVVCLGSCRVRCHSCKGRGRMNHIELEMLPKGEWPKWCRSCGGSGLEFCSRCLGTGEYRYIMGFKFMNKDVDDVRYQKSQ